MAKGISIQASLYELCKKQINNDKEFKKIISKEYIQEINEELYEKYRFFKLKRILDKVYKKSKFYKKLFDENNIKLEDIKTINDLKKIPFTTPEDIARGGYDFLCTSQGDVARIITFTSSGTTGPEKRIFFSPKDIDIMTDYMAAGMNTVTEDDGVIQILLPNGPAMGQSDLLRRGVSKMKGKAVIAGMMLSSEEQIKSIIKNKSTVLFGETRLIYRITKEMENKYDLRQLGIKVLFLTTSYLSESMRRNLINAWGCRISTHYGLTEMGLGLAVDCPDDYGYHYDDLDVIAEVVDPKTGEILPCGEEGELVFTSITREAMPIIRYRSHDIGILEFGDCNCGKNMQRISHIRARLESYEVIGDGDKIYPSLFDEIMFKIPEIIDYDIILEKGKQTDNLIFKVELLEYKKWIEDEIVDALKQIETIKNNITKGSIREIRIEIIPQDSLKNMVHFKKKIIVK